MKSDLESILPKLARIIEELWAASKSPADWRDMQSYLAGAGAALVNVSEYCFSEIQQELELLEQICAEHIRSNMRAAA